MGFCANKSLTILKEVVSTKVPKKHKVWHCVSYVLNSTSLPPFHFSTYHVYDVDWKGFHLHECGC